MANENQNPETVKEETPEWAKQLQETLTDLPHRLKEVLTPPQQEAPPANQPVEIVLPQQPEQEEPPQPQEVELPQEEKQQEQPKKRKFLDWLL